MFIPRLAAATLLELVRGFPVLGVTGPRQSGKTTLVRSVFPDKAYVSLEDFEARRFADEDPLGFLAQFPDGAIFDEAQRSPKLFSYLQINVDEDRRPGRFVLTGSNQFGLLSGVTQSLAGRIGLLRLLPFSLAELNAAGLAPGAIDDVLLRGMYPSVYDREVRPDVWYDNYVATYVERDVNQLLKVQDQGAFRQFVGVVAANTGGPLNLARLAAGCQIARSTAEAWLSVLEASFLIHRLPSYHANFGKRLVKAPKVYFLDTGLASALLGIRSVEDLKSHRMRGALFETWVVGEILKSRHNRAIRPDLSFWRDHSGLEVDLIMGLGGRGAQIEVKASARVGGDDLRSILRWRELAGEDAGPSFLVYGGEKAYRRSGCEVVPWRSVGRIGI